MPEQLESDTRKRTSGETSFLLNIIESRYCQQVASLEPVLLTPTKRIFKAVADEKTFMVRSYVAVSEDKGAHDIVANLLFLEKESFPAERLIRTKDGANVWTSQGWHTLVTAFVDGKPIPSTPDAFHQIGKTLGALHALDYRSANPPVPISKLVPKREVAYALSELTPVRGKVPYSLRPRFDFIENSLQELPDCEALPKVFIHSDCHPGNGAQREDGTIVLYDWQDAGLGPAVIDLAYLLLSCDGMAPWLPQSSFTGNDPWPEETIKSIVEGYTKHHRIGTQEVERLPDAILFRSLIFGAVNFLKVVFGETKDDESLWWWRRYTASEEIAKRARLGQSS
jgi:Ser/Thr protein kinase RdoA (MazF antagonist)